MASSKGSVPNRTGLISPRLRPLARRLRHCQTSWLSLAVSSEPASKPVQRVSVPGLSGVVFVYLSQAEEEVVTGLAAAFVAYRADGKPAYAYKASEILRYEGWGRVTASAVGAASVQRCSLEIEYFRYGENGDVIAELESPVRTPRFCEQLVGLSPGK